MTFLEMQTDALDILHEIQNHSQYSLVKLKHYINRGNVQFVRLTECIEGVIDITTVADQVEYTQADGPNLQYLKRPYNVRYVDVATENGYKLDPYPGGYTQLPRTRAYGTPDWYC